MNSRDIGREEFPFLDDGLTQWNLIARRYDLMIGKASHFMRCPMRS